MMIKSKTCCRKEIKWRQVIEVVIVLKAFFVLDFYFKLGD